MYLRPVLRRRELPEEAAADLIDSEPNVSVGTFNCARFEEVCAQLKVGSLPTAKLAIGGNWTTYYGARYVRAYLDFVSDHCGTERGLDGLLRDDAGTVRAADDLVTEFLTAEAKADVIERAKKITGADFYVKAMERWVAKGSEQLAKDVAVMRELLEQRKGSIKALDGIKRRYNVPAEFFPIVDDSDKILDVSDLSL
jgi:hypothetical protein